MRNNWIHYLFTILIISLTVWIIYTSSEVKIIPYLYKITQKVYILLALVCMFFYWITEAFILKAIFNLSQVKQCFLAYMKIAMIGQYYNMITPFSSGGQPAQIYTMANDYKIPLGLATSITVNKFMIYHIIVTLFSVIIAFLNVRFIFSLSLLTKTFILFGLFLNSVGIILIFALCYNSAVVKKIVSLFLLLIKKIRLGKHISQDLLDQHIQEYKECLHTFLNNKRTLIIVSLFTLAQIIVYYSVTYFVYLSFGFTKASFLHILAIQSLLYMAVNYIPTPGNSGASEGGFYLLFGFIFPSSVLLYAVVLWRLIVYYFNLAVTGLIVLIDNLRKRFSPPET